MGEFMEPFINQDISNEKPKIFTDEFITSVVKKSFEDNEIPLDHNIFFVGAVDEQGLRAIIGVKRSPFGGELRINFIAEHDWDDGDNRAGARVIFSHK